MRAELTVLAGVVGALLLSMVAYRITPAGRKTSDDTGRGGSFVLGFWVRNWFYFFIRPLTRLSLSLRLSPFVYNALAIVFGLASMGLFATGHLATAGWMVLLSGFADVMDGEVARGQGVADARGAFLDSTLDRFAEFFAFVGMAWLFRSGPGGLIVVIALGGSLLVSYTRARGESVGVLCKFGIMQRAERMLLVGLGSILDPGITALAGWGEGSLLMGIVGIIAAGTVGTSIYRTVWIARALHENKES